MSTDLRLASWPMHASNRQPLHSIGMLKPALAEDRQPNAAKKKWSAGGLVLAFVIAAHVLVFAALLAQSAITPLPVEEPVVPITVSLVSEPVPTPEVTPVVPRPPKPVVKKIEPKPVPKPKIVSKPVPKTEPKPEPVTQQPVAHQSVVQQPLSPPVPEQVVTEQPSPAPVAPAPVGEKAPPAPEPAPIVQPPSFGAAYLNNPPPRYPSLSRRLGEEGRVLLRVLVAKNGSADTVEVEKGSGSDRLDAAALEAVRKWKFVPVKQNNRPVSAYVLVPMKFSLRDS